MNVKAGDLAYVIRDEFPEVIGRVVEVLEYVGPDESEPGLFWRVHFSGRPAPYSDWGAPRGTVSGYDFIVQLPDEDLRPISGVPVHDEQHDEVKEPA